MIDENKKDYEKIIEYKNKIKVLKEKIEKRINSDDRKKKSKK